MLWHLPEASASDIDLLTQRVKAIVNETAEYFKAIVIDLLNTKLNQTLAEYKQMELNMRTRVNCALAMSTRDDYMSTMLLGANLSTCSDFSIPSEFNHICAQEFLIKQ